MTKERFLLCDDDALRSNSLNLMRLFFATLVVFSHAFPLTAGSNAHEPLFLFSKGHTTFGRLAVDAFFSISGFLIIRSYLVAPTIDEYFRKRVLRIYPAYIAAIAISALLAALTVDNPLHFLREMIGRESVLDTLTLKYGALEEAGRSFIGNAYRGVNGSLWTIQYEFLAYCCIAAYGLFKLFRFRALWLSLIAALLLINGRSAASFGESDVLMEFVAFFAAGVTAYVFRDRIVRSRMLAVVSLLVLIAALRLSPWLAVLTPLAATYLLLCVAAFGLPRVFTWTRTTDLSYGVYLYAFPIEQSLIYWFRMRDPVLLFFVALVPTFALALMSWRFIERPSLSLKHTWNGTGVHVKTDVGKAT